VIFEGAAITEVVVITEDEAISEVEGGEEVILMLVEVGGVIIVDVQVILTLVEVAEAISGVVQGVISEAGVEVAVVILLLVGVVEVISEVAGVSTEVVIEAVVGEITEVAEEEEFQEVAMKTDGNGVMTGIMKELSRTSLAVSK